MLRSLQHQVSARVVQPQVTDVQAGLKHRIEALQPPHAVKDSGGGKIH